MHQRSKTFSFILILWNALGRREEELEIALRLCAHEGQRDPRDHLQRCVMARLLTAILEDAAYFRQQGTHYYPYSSRVSHL